MVKSIEYNSYYQLEIDFTLAVDCGVILANKNYNVAIFVNILYIAHSTWNIIDCFWKLNISYSTKILRGIKFGKTPDATFCD